MTLNDGAEFRLPPLENIFSISFLGPFFTYYFIFHYLSKYVKANFFLNFTTFKRYRLQNLTICLFHSTVAAYFVLLFAMTHPYEIFYDIIHYDHWLHRQLVIFSQAYFVHDLLDMFEHELNVYVYELALHHVLTFFFLGAAVWSGKFLIYAYWALAMEFHSIFLHLRTMSNITGYLQESPKLSKALTYFNLVAAIIFRIGVQTFQISWAIVNMNNMHGLYLCVAIIGGTIFLVINIILILRVATSDGIIKPRYGFMISVNRDNKKD
uniref:TLC domain-containing protein n=1 Tax=Parastrongyloides trichosuri TaxID=131310 RepID=A0A0N5A1V0_PARTI